MKFKKGSGTMTGAIVSILSVMLLFFGCFLYINNNYESAEITSVIGYNESYNSLQDSLDNLTSNVEDMKIATQNIAEADSLVAAVAWNGLSGIAAALRLFLGIIDVAVDVWNALMPGLAFLPTWIKLLIEVGIIAWIVLIAIGAFKGETKT